MERKKFADMSELIKKFGASVVVGLIDESGMAVSLERKLEVARRRLQTADRKNTVLMKGI